MNTVYTAAGEQEYSFRNPLPFLLCSPRVRLYRHLFILLLLWVVIQTTDFRPAAAYLVKTIATLFLAGIGYCNMYWLMPVFLFRKKTLHYFGSCLLLAAASYGLQHVLQPMMTGYLLPGTVISHDTPEDFFAYMIIIIVVIGAATAVKLFQQWVRDTIRISQLENARLQIELAHLKSQINPHFLFNMLNNTDVLIRVDPEKASEVIHKLSDLLRYQLYDGDRELVLLQQEVLFLHHYLYLEKIRRDYLDIQLIHTGPVGQVWVPPLLFITFVENAIKHNTANDPAAYVHLHIRYESGVLTFHCSNSCKKRPAGHHTQSAGIGLANIRRRLELLYPDKYALRITDEGDSYKIYLSIQL
ncbi:sensor histidine kinase [Chitinophaga nivalis]|nr:histidine kinase [Chitinophaga nivalis]MCW3462969.1 histidine kinase [Chitinophaga nivalis]